MDTKVLTVQKWLNSTYQKKQGWKNVAEDGYTGGGTVAGLIRGLQIELGENTIDGIMGSETRNSFNDYFGGHLNKDNYNKNTNIVKILTGGFYCRGIEPGSFTDKFTDSVVNAVKQLQEQIGIEKTGNVNGKLMAAVLTTDPFELGKNNDSNIREIQQKLNKWYDNYLDTYIPTIGEVERKTMEVLLKGIQSEIGAAVDGFWGEDTMSKLPTIPSSSSTTRLVYLLQFALYVNGYNPNGFDGAFGNGVINAIKKCQEDYKLGVDGYCGRKTWGALLVSCGDTTRSTNACDTRFEITQEVANKLKADGYSIIGRYIVGGDFKELRPNELKLIFDNGLKAFLIYQAYDRNIKNFGPIEGGKAAITANGAIIKHKIPDGAIVYFAVDMDVYEDQIDDYIIPYFRGINKHKNSSYKVGIYGPRLVCQKIIDEGLAEYCFVADMSYKYSCNIGKKIPKSCSFDQFNEIKDYRNIIDLDKVMYSGNANLVTKLKSGNPNFEIVNKNLYEKLEYVYNLAKEYEPNGTIAKWNYMVVNYFRHASYKGAGWDTIVGTVLGWINYVNNRLPDNVSEDIYSKQMYIYDRKLNVSMQFGHMAAVLASLLYNSNIVYTTYIDSNGNEIRTQSPEDLNIEFTSRQSKITDLCGWAGDLVQLLNNTNEEKLQNQEGNTDVEKLMSLIGSSNGEFDQEDLCQDIDAVNVCRNFKNTPIKEVLENYYEQDNCFRINKFIANRKLIGNLPTSVNNDSSDYEVCKALAYRYLSKEDPETAILVNLFNFINYGILGANRWKNNAPEAWKNKIKNYIELEL